MAQKQGKGKGGRAKAKMAKRAANRTTQRHKIIRVLKSCGLRAAEAYGVKYIVLPTLRDYQAKHPVRRRGEKHDSPQSSQPGV